MPRRAEIRDKQNLETPHPLLPHSGPWFSSFYGMEEFHAQVLLVSPSLETPCALTPLLTSCCLWEKHQEH